MYRYIILAIYPLLFVACAIAAYQTRRLSRNFPSVAWTFVRRLMFGFMVFQVYGAIRILTVHRVFTWVDPIYVIGVLVFCVGLIRFFYLLLQDAKGLRTKAIKVIVPALPLSGDLPPEFWRQTFTEVVRENIKPEYLVEVELLEP